MPIFTPDQLRATMPGQPLATKPAPDPMVVCALAETDKGEPCRHCWYPSGSGHGKEHGT